MCCFNGDCCCSGSGGFSGLEDSVTDIAVGTTAAAAAAASSAGDEGRVVRADWLLGFVGSASCVSFSSPISSTPVSAPLGCGIFLSVCCCGGGLYGGEVGRRCAGDSTAGFAAGVFC